MSKGDMSHGSNGGQSGSSLSGTGGYRTWASGCQDTLLPNEDIYRLAEGGA